MVQQQELKQKLKQNGFKKAKGYKSLYVNADGKVCNTETGRYLTPTSRNYIHYKKKDLPLPKLVLQAFADEPIRSGQVEYLDGNKKNLNVNNLRYKTQSRFYCSAKIPTTTNKLKAIRCYYPVREDFSVKDKDRFKRYMSMIAKKREFFQQNAKNIHLQVFETYLHWRNIEETANAHRLGMRDCRNIINQFLNMLIDETLADLKSGKLSLHPFEKPPKSKTEIIREYNKERKAKGVYPISLNSSSCKRELVSFYDLKREMEKKEARKKQAKKERAKLRRKRKAIYTKMHPEIKNKLKEQIASSRN